jgi:hypothetical protein
MTNYFHKGDVIQLRPNVPTGFRRDVRLSAPSGEAVSDSPADAPVTGIPTRRRSILPLVIVCAFLWGLILAALTA